MHTVGMPSSQLEDLIRQKHWRQLGSPCAGCNSVILISDILDCARYTSVECALRDYSTKGSRAAHFLNATGNEMRKLFLLISVLALSGCAHVYRQQAQEAEMRARAICESVTASPEVAALLENVPADPSMASVAQLADKGKPTSQQKAIIAKIDQYNAPCTAANTAYLSQYAPAAAPIVLKANQDIKLLWAKLLNDELSFGEFNAERAKIAAAAFAEAQAAESTRVANSRQLQAQEYQNYLQMQQNINAFKPKRTNCYTYGNNVQCTHY